MLAALGVPVRIEEATRIHSDGLRAVIAYGCTGQVSGLLVLAWVLGSRQRWAVKLGHRLRLGAGRLAILIDWPRTAERRSRDDIESAQIESLLGPLGR